jgi:predicted DNA-binding protein
MTPKLPATEKKKNVTVRLHPNLIKSLKAASDKTGLKMATIIEQGIEKRVKEVMK